MCFDKIRLQKLSNLLFDWKYFRRKLVLLYDVWVVEKFWVYIYLLLWGWAEKSGNEKIFDWLTKCSFFFLKMKVLQLLEWSTRVFKSNTFAIPWASQAIKQIVPRVSPKNYHIGLAKSQSIVIFGLSPMKEMLSLSHNSISAKKDFRAANAT